MVTESSSLHGLKAKLSTSIKEHSKRCFLDSFLYNGGTTAVLLATTAATFLPDSLGAWFWLPKALTAFATFWVALERVLNFGARWRFHLEMKNAYQVIEDMIDYSEHLPESKKEDYIQSIWQELMILRRREKGIPIGDGKLIEQATKRKGV
ncbi:MAG TPA: hypothetical protein VKA60_25850 [Blastocatellia bacterium]|nr:hypothetical protein [Blastocatellia bacterium]